MIAGNDVQVAIEDNGPRFHRRSVAEGVSAVGNDEGDRTWSRLSDRPEGDRVAHGNIAAGNRAEGGAQFRLRLPVVSSS